MNIRILDLLDGARKATGAVVIIDVFRAFSLECYIIDKNPLHLYAVSDKDLAYKYKKDHKDAVLIGERHGVKLEGFDYGNSPSEIKDVDLKNKTIVHTTSAGTQGIEAATNADIILTGSMLNAQAIAKYIIDNGYEDVSLVGMGIETISPSEEDTLCALYIKSLLENNPLPDMDKRIEHLKYTTGAKFFDEKLKSIFPKDDFYLSTILNKFNFVLKVNKNKDGLHEIEKINI